MNSTSDRCRRWWPPQDWADGECGPAAPSLRPKPNAPPELDLASLLHECFVPLDDLVPSCPVPPAAGTQVIASTTDEDHHQGTSERDTSFEGGGDVYDVEDTYNLVSSVLKVSWQSDLLQRLFGIVLCNVGVCKLEN